MYFFLTSSIPPSTLRRMILLDTVYLFPFDSNDKDAWYSRASSLHTDGITSFVLVLPLYLC